MTVADPAYQHFLTRLRQARLDAALTQEQVAAKLGVHQSFVAKCEGGDRRVDVAEPRPLRPALWQADWLVCR